MEKILFPFDFLHQERRLATPLCGHAYIGIEQSGHESKLPLFCLHHHQP
jgi:hypothetical protein